MAEGGGTHVRRCRRLADQGAVGLARSGHPNAGRNFRS